MEQNSFEIFIDDENKIIHYHHKGILQVEEIRDAWKQLLLMEEFTANGYNLLSDYSEADFEFSMDKLESILELLYSFKDTLNDQKEAIVVNKPISTAMSYIFEAEIFKFLNFQVKTFTTKKNALEWLCR
jgi:hypothetical protein